jgi:hypothetical protein
MTRATAVLLMVLAGSVCLTGCDSNKESWDPVGFSSFFVENHCAFPIQVEIVHASHGETPVHETGAIPASQRMDLGRHGAMWPPYPFEFFATIKARKSDRPAAEAVVVYQAPSMSWAEDIAADERVWQKTVRRADYPPEWEYTLVLDDASLSR